MEIKCQMWCKLSNKRTQKNVEIYIVLIWTPYLLQKYFQISMCFLQMVQMCICILIERKNNFHYLHHWLQLRTSLKSTTDCNSKHWPSKIIGHCIVGMCGKVHDFFLLEWRLIVSIIKINCLSYSMIKKLVSYNKKAYLFPFLVNDKLILLEMQFMLQLLHWLKLYFKNKCLEIFKHSLYYAP